MEAVKDVFERAGNKRLLIGFEESGMVRRAFAARGFDAWSCDLEPAQDRSNQHMQCDIREALDEGPWDLLAVFHPPCTRLCLSGLRWLHTPPRGRTLESMWSELDEGAALFSVCWNADVPRIAVENPKMHRHAKARIENYEPPAQTVQPWMFGDPEFKGLSWYLRGLPALVPTADIQPPAPGTTEHRAWSKVHRAPPGPDRARQRSRTHRGHAVAIAQQWGDALLAEEPDACAA